MADHPDRRPSAERGVRSSNRHWRAGAARGLDESSERFVVDVADRDERRDALDPQRLVLPDVADPGESALVEESSRFWRPSVSVSLTRYPSSAETTRSPVKVPSAARDRGSILPVRIARPADAIGAVVRLG
jgi:hypothetical protein